MLKNCYQIITDETALRAFIDWLPQLKEHEKYYMCLFSRKKYCPEVPWIKTDKSQMKRFLSDKERMFDKIAQLECPVGAYTINEQAIPQESLALYITPNPRDMWKAVPRSIKALATVIECEGKNSNPHQEVMSEIHRTCGQKVFIDFDIDTKDQDTLREAIDLVDGRCDLLETRGGYHLMVKSEDAKIGFTEKLWYKKLTALADVSADPHSMVPCVGCYQGGFTPRFVDPQTFL
jgi:hypothetical protein